MVGSADQLVSLNVETDGQIIGQRWLQGFLQDSETIVINIETSEVNTYHVATVLQLIDTSLLRHDQTLAATLQACHYIIDQLHHLVGVSKVILRHLVVEPKRWTVENVEGRHKVIGSIQDLQANTMVSVMFEVYDNQTNLMKFPLEIVLNDRSMVHLRMFVQSNVDVLVAKVMITRHISIPFVSTYSIGNVIAKQ